MGIQDFIFSPRFSDSKHYYIICHNCGRTEMDLVLMYNHCIKHYGFNNLYINLYNNAKKWCLLLADEVSKTGNIPNGFTKPVGL